MLAMAAVASSLAYLPFPQGTIGFFHPFADGGGGGERVLWCAACHTQQLRMSKRTGLQLRVKAGSSSWVTAAVYNTAHVIQGTHGQLRTQPAWNWAQYSSSSPSTKVQRQHSAHV